MKENSFFGNQTIQRLTIYFLLWAIASLACLPNSLLFFFVAFLKPYILFWIPTGFAKLLDIDDDYTLIIVLLGWIFYFTHAFFTFRTHHQPTFYLLLGLLAIALALNVQGCRQMEFFDPTARW